MKDLEKALATTLRKYLNERKILKEEYSFAYNCVSPRSSKELNYIINNMEEISADLFLNCSLLGGLSSREIK